MPARRLLLPWLVALTLLFGQAAAFAHSLSHLGTHDPALPDQTCEACIAQASLGSAPPQPPLVLPILPADPVAARVAVLPPVSVVVQSAQARAPPAPV